MKKKPFVIVDLYAGAGGASTGMLKALAEFGIEPSYGVAVNHWPVAIDTHTVNHPNIVHICESLERVDPCKAVPGGRVDILWASPECTHHSRARGGKPMQDQSRSGANHILAWLDKLYVANLLIENVPEWEDWGPLSANNLPIKNKIGANFRAFIASLEARNYRLEYRVICCADYGDATTRERLILIASRTNRVVWEEPTHRSADKVTDLFGDFKPWKVARECIDWTDLGTSLNDKPLKCFETFACSKPVTIETEVMGKFQKIDVVCSWTKTRQKSKKGKPIKQCPKCKSKKHLKRSEELSPLSPNTMRRIFAGLEKFSGIPFILETRSDGDRVRSVDKPLQTVTAESRAIGLIGSAIVGAGGPSQAGEPKSVDRPLGTVMGKESRGLASIILGQQSDSAARSTDEPLPAIATDGAISLTTPIIVQTDQTGSERQAKSVNEPIGSVVSKQNQGLVTSFVLPNEGLHKGNAPRSIEKPLPTATGKGAGFLVSCCHGEGDDTRRQHDPDEPMPTLAGSNQFAVANPFIVRTNNRSSNETNAKSVDKPIPTITTEPGLALVNAHKGESFLVSTRHGDSERHHDTGEPLPTLTAKGDLAKITPFIVRLRGTGKKQVQESPQSIEQPIGAISTSGAHHALASFMTTYYGNGTAEPVTKPLPTQSTKDRFLLVNPQTNEQHEIIIYFRLLKLRELANAHSFPASYVFKGTKTQGVKQVGNSNPVEMTCGMTRSVLRQYLKRNPIANKVAA